MALKSTKFLGRKIGIKHDVIEALAKGKRVVHYGCVDDDFGIIKEKIAKNRYLHKLITDASKSTIGIDINKAAFPSLKNDLGIDNIFYGDVEDPKTFTVDKTELSKAQVLLIPDLIEHLNNPGKMLSGIKDAFNSDIKIYILTPNPVAWYNFVATLFNKEIYTDYHTIYFTTESMKVLLDRYGILIDRVLPVTSPKQRGTVVGFLDTVVCKAATFISPAFSDLYMYECRVDRSKKVSS